MRWQPKSCDWKGWHKWFAWHPVNVGGTMVWLETIYRKQKGTGYGATPIWEYNLEGQF
jgi:hypothetical protein